MSHRDIAELVGQGIGLVIGVICASFIGSVAGKTDQPSWKAGLMGGSFTVVLMTVGWLLGRYAFGG